MNKDMRNKKQKAKNNCSSKIINRYAATFTIILLLSYLENPKYGLRVVTSLIQAGMIMIMPYIIKDIVQNINSY